MIDFNDCSLQINGRKFKFTPKDVEIVLGLKSEVKAVDQNWLIDDGSTDAQLNKIFGENSITMNSLKENLLKMSSYGDEFKMKFTMYILSDLLCPTTNTKVRKGFVNIVKDVDRLKSINWGKLVVDHLVPGLERKKKRHQKGLSGCFIFLEVSYLTIV